MTEKLFRPWKKSELQIKLESEEWILITNVKTGGEYMRKLQELHKVYKEVKSEEAYDTEGILIQDHNLVAVYARGKNQETA